MYIFPCKFIPNDLSKYRNDVVGTQPTANTTQNAQPHKNNTVSVAL